MLHKLLLILATFSTTFPPRFEGEFEEMEFQKIELIESVLSKKDPMIMQAGGYYGDQAIQLATMWPTGKILSFEPNPHAFELLCIKTAPFENIYTFNLALNSYSGTAPFYICHGSTGNNNIYEHVSSLLKPSEEQRAHYIGPTIDVDCTTLDDWCKEQKISQIDFLLLDVRGAELHVLVNSPHILETIECILVHTNFFPFRTGMTFYPDLRVFLEKSGFKLLSHWYRAGFEGDAIFIKKS